jgi:hypothetical protein
MFSLDNSVLNFALGHEDSQTLRSIESWAAHDSAIKQYPVSGNRYTCHSILHALDSCMLYEN